MTAAPQVSSWPGRVFPLAAVLVVLLALGAVIWPRGREQGGQGLLVVYDSSGLRGRQDAVYEPLADFLAEITGRELGMSLVTGLADFHEQVENGAEFVLCPDGLGLRLDPAAFAPLVIARRAVPHNLRPRSVLVYRKATGYMKAPWRRVPGRTVFGDSLSLVATAGLRVPGSASSAAGAAGRAALRNCAWGPDPFDHGPVLHAARLGAFDFAVVRQWDADRFFKEDLLSSLEWGREILSPPVPDIVLLGRSRLTPQMRLQVRQELAALGRAEHSSGAARARLLAGLDRLHLAGFNLLLEPELESARRHFASDWPPAAK